NPLTTNRSTWWGQNQACLALGPHLPKIETKYIGENDMKGTTRHPYAACWATTLTALGLVLGIPAPALAQTVSAESLVGRAQVEDLLTRYYYNFGKAGGESFGAFYTD